MGPFDRVELALPSGEVKTLSVSEFEALPLDQRVRAILGKRLRFFSGRREVSMKEALSGKR